MTFKIPITFLLCFCAVTVFSQTQIDGKAPEWAGKTIRLIKILDPISETESELSTDTIQSDGSFSLQADIKNIGTLWISVKRFSAPILLQPDADYQIILVPKPQNKLVDTWRKGSFEYGFENLDSTDVNSILGDFDDAYYNFYLDNAQLINSPRMRSKIHDFEIHFDSIPGDKFINTYRSSTIGEMKLSAGIAPKAIYATYFYNKPVHPQNSAWYSLFNLFYADYFQGFDSRFGGATVSNRIKLGLSADSLSRLVNIDPFMANDTIKQWVLLKSVDEVYENTAYPKSFLDSLLRDIKENAKTAEIAKVAMRMQKKVENKLIGTQLQSLTTNWEPAFSKPDKALPCLLMVSSPGNTESLREKRILENLVKKYGDFFYPIEVEIDATKPPQKELWPIYRPRSDYDFLQKFQIYGIPHFIWIDADGIISEDGIEKPSEGLESRLFKLKATKEKENQIKVGH